MAKKSQQTKVLEYLHQHGAISKDQAKRMKIGRLSSYIERLRREGWYIETVRLPSGKTFYQWG